jgi:nitroimidazol reductase NimA-like FMN-containing flavoprotein (pyridoxamine 5'-phosphate oxidase superfamily)
MSSDTIRDPDTTSESRLKTARTELRRLPERGRYERRDIDAILDEAVICHIGFVENGQPFVIPTIHARVGDDVYVHGSAASRMLRTLRTSVPLCLTVTLLDGLVLARSAFHHSVNYRSVVILGEATVVDDPHEKARALDAIVEHVVAGRTADARAGDDKEKRATIVLRLPIDEASAKVRTGGPKDDEDDMALPVWAGVVPLRLVPGEPITDPDCALPVPEYASRYTRPGW